MSRVLILGASGMLGSSLAPKLVEEGHDVIKQSRSNKHDIKINILNQKDWLECLNELNPEVIVNLVAATNVDECELNPQSAFDANVGPLLSLKQASTLTTKRPHVIHISTDQLYDGIGPHLESNIRPCNVYALSKFAAELAINDYPATILRTNFFGLSYAPGRESFSDWIVKSIKSEQPITLFHDVLFSAIHVSTLCDFINLVIKKKTIGTFNVGASDGISKSEFGLCLARLVGLDTSIIKIGSVKNFKFEACRPLDMRMNTTIFEKAFSCKSPLMLTEICKAADEYCF